MLLWFDDFPRLLPPFPTISSSRRHPPSHQLDKMRRQKDLGVKEGKKEGNAIKSEREKRRGDWGPI